MNSDQRRVLKSSKQSIQWAVNSLSNISDTKLGYYFRQEAKKLVTQMEKALNEAPSETSPTPPEAA